MSIPVPTAVRRYAKEDVTSMLDKFNKKYPEYKARLSGLSLETDSDSDSDDQFTVYATAEVQFTDKSPKKVEITLEYVIDGEDVYAGFDDANELAEDLHDRMKDSAVSASVKAASAIQAADDDLLEDEVDDDFEGALDDMADDIEDMQDSLDDVHPDDPSIEPDNNISGHYIAECEMCGGIFISAVIESDAPVESITGTCPLCEKHSQQNLRWVVRDVE